MYADFKEQRKLNLMNKFPKGTKIRLIRLLRPDFRIPNGSEGVVVGYNNDSALIVQWKSGYRMAVLPYAGDWIEKITGK